MRFDFIDLASSGAGPTHETCISQLIDSVQALLSTAPEMSSDAFAKTKTFRQLLRSLVESDSVWNWKFLGIDAIPDGLFNENYVLDLMSDKNFGNCNQRHRLLVELCFDNRQAIGTNVFKLQVAAQQFQARTGGKAYCLIVCGDRKALKKGQWDSGVGDEEEYQIAISTGYREFLTSPFSLLVLRNT